MGVFFVLKYLIVLSYLICRKLFELCSGTMLRTCLHCGFSQSNTLQKTANYSWFLKEKGVQRMDALSVFTYLIVLSYLICRKLFELCSGTMLRTCLHCGFSQSNTLQKTANYSWFLKEKGVQRMDALSVFTYLIVLSYLICRKLCELCSGTMLRTCLHYRTVKYFLL